MLFYTSQYRSKIHKQQYLQASCCLEERPEEEQNMVNDILDYLRAKTDGEFFRIFAMNDLQARHVA